MAKKEVAKKLITVESYGALVELGGISGPILNPCLIDVPTIIRMINGHKKVYEVNPNNRSEKVRLTLRNVTAVNFKAPVVVAASPAQNNVAETKVEETVVKETKKEVKNDFKKK